MRDWFYFGCREQAGHHLFTQDKNICYGGAFEKFDGLLAPVPEREPYVAVLSRLACVRALIAQGEK